jgi:hypothetical protein
MAAFTFRRAPIGVELALAEWLPRVSADAGRCDSRPSSIARAVCCAPARMPRSLALYRPISLRFRTGTSHAIP